MAFRATNILRQELKLRPAFELALRASCLQLVLARWGLETASLMGMQGERTANDDDRKIRAVESITNALYESGLEDHATQAEKEMLDKPFKTWEYKDFMYGDNWESFGVLQWLLGRQHTIPAYFSNFDRARLFQGTGIMPASPPSIEQFVNSFMSLQSHQSVDSDSLKHEIDVAEAWYWRARAQVILKLREDLKKDESGAESDSPVESELRSKHVPHSLRKMAESMPKIIPDAAKRAHEKGIIKQLEGGDFGIIVEMKESESEDTGGSRKSTSVPYTQLDSDHLDAIRKIAESRFFAFAWSVGKLDQWELDEMSELVSINPISSIWSPDEQ